MLVITATSEAVDLCEYYGKKGRTFGTMSRPRPLTSLFVRHFSKIRAAPASSNVQKFLIDCLRLSMPRVSFPLFARLSGFALSTNRRDLTIDSHEAQRRIGPSTFEKVP